MFPSPVSSYLVGMATAAWFGYVAYRARRGVVLWTIGGGCLGLAVSMICVGLAHAVALPYSSSQVVGHQFRGLALALLLLGVTGAGVAFWFPPQPCEPSDEA